MSDYLKPLNAWVATFSTCKWGVTRKALCNARKLAQSELNLAIVLIEPCNSHNMSYEETFDRSNTLQEIDRLIRECNNDYSLLDVTHIKPLVSEKVRETLARLGQELDLNAAHPVLEEIWKARCYLNSTMPDQQGGRICNSEDSMWVCPWNKNWRCIDGDDVNYGKLEKSQIILCFSMPYSVSLVAWACSSNRRCLTSWI